MSTTRTVASHEKWRNTRNTFYLRKRRVSGDSIGGNPRVYLVGSSRVERIPPRSPAHVIPRKVAKRMRAPCLFPTNLSALTNRRTTPNMVGEVHLHRSSSLKTNAEPGPAGPSTFLRRRARWIWISGPFVARDTSRSLLAEHADPLSIAVVVFTISRTVGYIFWSWNFERLLWKGIVLEWRQRSNMSINFELISITVMKD